MKSDYLILGAGASGLMLAYRMAKDPFFDNKSIILIDKDKKKGNNRTWCFWEKESNEWDSIITKKWNDIFFGAKGKIKKISLKPYSYKMIRSGLFYETLWNYILSKDNFSFHQEEVTNINTNQNNIEVHGKNSTFRASKVFNSLPINDSYLRQSKFPVLKQHFVGWFIETKEDHFEVDAATFMDFNIEQKGNTRFMYILPISKKEALFEYTLFSEYLLNKEDYEKAIENYLKEKNINDYIITEKEQGSIPMTAYRFASENKKNLLNIGSAGGWTKASTGYTFSNCSRKTKELLSFLKNSEDLSRFEKKSKHQIYDMLLLDVLHKNNELGQEIFSKLFEKVEIQTILEFLDDKSSIRKDLKIMFSVPRWKFTIALIKRLVNQVQ
jgi:lycopene beta-cyclase